MSFKSGDSRITFPKEIAQKRDEAAEACSETSGSTSVVDGFKTGVSWLYELLLSRGPQLGSVEAESANHFVALVGERAMLLTAMVAARDAEIETLKTECERKEQFAREECARLLDANTRIAELEAQLELVKDRDSMGMSDRMLELFADRRAADEKIKELEAQLKANRHDT